MALTRQGGKIAMVVPKVWMTRQYSQPLKQFLGRHFKVDYIAEDANGTWFQEAQVRTQLFVATRDKPNTNETSFTHLLIHNRASSHQSLIGNHISEKALEFALRAGNPPEIDGIEVSSRSLGKQSQGIPLSEMGWNSGQGFRSGANDFFYVLGHGNEYFSKLTSDRPLSLPDEALVPAIFKQSDLSRVNGSPDKSPQHYVLFLRDFVLERDRSLRDTRVPISGDLELLINIAEEKTYSRNGEQKTIPEFSAVRTNSNRLVQKGVPSFWYHLPPFTPRHTPAIFLPRVNGNRPTPFLNTNDNYIVDANFVSLWPGAEPRLSTEAMFALLKSPWAWLYMEENLTVLGGGALKVEAIDLRNIPWPDLVWQRTKKLHEVGTQIINGRLSQSEADSQLARLLGEAPEKSTSLATAKSLFKLRKHHA